MDSPYSFSDSSMVFHAAVQRRHATPQAHGVSSREGDQLSNRRTPLAYPPPPPPPLEEPAYSPLPALPTVLRARSHLRSMPHHGLSPITAPSTVPAYTAPRYRPLTLATNSPHTKNSLGYILGQSRVPTLSHEHTHTHTRHIQHERRQSFPSFAMSRFEAQTHTPTHAPQRGGAARGRLTSDSSAESSYASSPLPGPRLTALRSSPASVRPIDLESAPPTENAKKKRKARICTTDGCTKYVVDHGLCIRHGGGKRCYIDGCDCRAQNRGLCWKHGGFTICKIDGCTKRAKSRGICWSHGGGTRCKRDDCSKIAVSNGLCWAHGGGKRCVFGKCRKPASERTNNFCNEHHAKESRDDDDDDQ